MSKEDIDDLAWRIMIANDEYEELNKICALNGILYENYFDNLSEEEQEKLLERLAIGIQAFNISIKQAIDDKYDTRRLPSIKVSGNDQS